MYYPTVTSECGINFAPTKIETRRDEPTRGVDIATKVEIYRMMAHLASAGMAVLLISSEMPEAIGMSDRLLVMRSGRIVAALERSELTMERVFALAVGVETDPQPSPTSRYVVCSETPHCRQQSRTQIHGR